MVPKAGKWCYARLLYLSPQLHLIYQQILSILKENHILKLTTSLIFISMSVVQVTMFSYPICHNILTGSLLLLLGHTDCSPYSSSKMIFLKSDPIIPLLKFLQSHLPYCHPVVCSLTRPSAISPLSILPPTPHPPLPTHGFSSLIFHRSSLSLNSARLEYLMFLL